MSGILRLESLTKGNTLKQGDKTPLKYRLFDADGEQLNIAGKSAKVRLVYPDFLTIGYEKDGLTVAQDDTVTFTIDTIIPSKLYHVEIIVDDKFIFPSRADESKFTVDKSSLGTETNIVEIVGVDAVVRKAVDLINGDPSLIIDEDKLVTDIISNTGIGSIEEYHQQFNDVIKELSKDKDYHSLPEIAGARGGFGTLGERLNDTTAQLAQKVNKNQGEITSADLSQEVKEQMTGGSVAVVGKNAILTENIVDKQVAPEKTTFVRASTNLYNKTTDNEKEVVLVTGEIVNNENYNSSQFIKVTPNTEYTSHGFYTIAEFDSNYDFIRRVEPPTGDDVGKFSFTTAENTTFLKANYTRQSYFVARRLNLGGQLLPFEHYGLKIVSSALGEKYSDVLTWEIKENQITNDMIEFLDVSSNLYDSSKDKVNKSVTNDGITTNDDYIMTDFIKVDPLETLTSYGFYYIGEFDVNKNYIRRVEIRNINEETFVTDQETRFIVGSYHKGSDYPKRRINRGNQLKPYEDFYVRVKRPLDIVSDFIVPSDNLYNETTDDKYTHILGTGNIVEHETYNTTDYIEIKPSETYTSHGFYTISEFDANQNFIRRVEPSSVDEAKAFNFTTSHRARYIRGSYHIAYEYEKRRINQGNKLNPFDVHGLKFKEGTALDNLNELINKEIDYDKFIFEQDISDTFTTSNVYEDYAEVVDNLTASQVYGLFDSLMAEHPDYITKTYLGDDDVGNEISLYEFKPTMPQSTEDINLPNVFINCGTHGAEKATSIATYLAFKEICNHWKNNPALEVLRHNVNFTVIPLLTPSSWNQNTRTNHNGVDINRNFPTNWVQGSPSEITYGGTHPASELETQYMIGVLDNNHYDVFIDFHNFFSGSSDDEFLWIPTLGKYKQRLALTLINKMTRHWSDTFDFIPEDYVAGYTSGSVPGTVATHARKVHGIYHSATFEICNVWKVKNNPVPYDEHVIHAGVEAIINWVLVNLNNFKY